ncbi:ArsR/SmtB family transcription factor [Nocardia sp. NPDC003482]|uniref:ArsR family transcriptional regulator n=1 Tax=Nocardia nova TaxID=37330 RepID=A0A2S5ZV55_9NOCA|nr:MULTISPECIES: metalloregulator ArsR/SmtB family transcription factor [Nocardia]MDN2495638.1 winged helix-turn-helix transcriptional regulator [Nocardia nova]PPJ01475.1 ArsR family transcriptional regulator [Nocardia nova]PPJ03254.1 ArsR family transcriptional regulator [Nocardia nova]PPJ19721.1 ArsR family transcriptional regulator [Nocardia nova]
MSAFRDVDLAILGDPMRKAIFERLARRPCSVGELAQELPITRQAVSQHLQVLKQGGLVVVSPQGTRRIYRINPEGLEAIQAYFQQIWDNALAAFQKAAEAAADDFGQEKPL